MSLIDTTVWLKKEGNLGELFKRFSLEEELSHDEYSIILACSISFLKSYLKDRRRGGYFEFGYSTVLSYSLQTGDYQPLFDVAANFGFYPIARYLLDGQYVQAEKACYSLIDLKLEPYSRAGIVETYDQFRCRSRVLKNPATDISYVAPTSFGKSSLIADLIERLAKSRMAVIVPTKSLLVQTFRLLSSRLENVRVICHDEMYSEGEDFVAVLTQERALRLLKNERASFDVLLIDEAHNLFEKSHRSILLSRVLRRNRLRNPSAKYYYFSPLVGDSENLKLESLQEISESRIRFNIKEPDISEYTLGGEIYKYNRFLDEFYFTGGSASYLGYMLERARTNNFVYIRSPKKIENFASIFSTQLDVSGDETLSELSNTLAKNVHKDFYCVDYVKKGLLYIHGRIPDLVKEYLEYKFREIEELRYLIANTVILEGVNLPIDNLYILSVHSLRAPQLWNLIGRVNRLNEVFNTDDGLQKLRPAVHFVNTQEFNSKKSNMSNKIKELRSTQFKDEVKNPTLPSFDYEKFVATAKKADSDGDARSEDVVSKVDSIIDRETYLVGLSGANEDIRALMYESSLDQIYSSLDNVFEVLEERAGEYILDEWWSKLGVVDKIYQFFIVDLEPLILDKAFLRLQNEPARNFYEMFVGNLHSLSLTEHINSTVKYFYARIQAGTGESFYVGSSYGEKPKDSGMEGFSPNHYVDLSKKTAKELVNLALVKIKMESDYVSFDLNRFVSALHDLSLLTDAEYNLFIYGSEERTNTEYVKLGLSGSLINRLNKDGQLDNMQVSSYGEITVNDDFKSYISTQDDLVQFEVNKYISID